MIIIAPYRGEFGFRCMYHAPWVNAMPGTKTVIMEKGFEALYPNCDFIYMRDYREDADRRARPETELEQLWEERLRGTFKKYMKTPFPLDQAMPRKYFIPKPYGDVSQAKLYDVTVCPRKRGYGADKNWPYWIELAEKLQRHNMRIFSAGHPESSYMIDSDAAWNRGGGYLDETIHAMLHSRIVVATDAGLAHLALMCGRPLLMITHKDGLVAPGTDDVGNDYWPVRMDRYNEENHTNAPIIQIHDGWDGADVVLDNVLRFLKTN